VKGEKKATDIDLAEVLRVTPLSIDGPVLVFREGHINWPEVAGASINNEKYSLA
jgi:hypothetical protein